MRIMAIAFLSSCIAASAQADLSVQFVEGAPKDTFIFENLSACPLVDADITVNLLASNGRLIFDVTERGAGVSVFQPFEIVEGADSLRDLPNVLDGDTAVRLSVDQLAAGGEIAFTIDVDDTAGRRATLVAGAEISGASVVIDARGQRISSYFREDASAFVALPPCPES